MVKQGSLFLLNKTFYLLLILFLIACSKESALVRDKNGDFINIENSQVISAKALEWRVGKGNNKGYVSKGFLSKIELPYFSDDDLIISFGRKETPENCTCGLSRTGCPFIVQRS